MLAALLCGRLGARILPTDIAALASSCATALGAASPDFMQGCASWWHYSRFRAVHPIDVWCLRSSASNVLAIIALCSGVFALVAAAFSSELQPLHGYLPCGKLSMRGCLRASHNSLLDIAAYG